jgi:hypothetical protein
MLNLLISADHYHRETYDQDTKTKGIYRSSWRHRQDVLPRPRVYTDHGDPWSRYIAEAKGIYRSSWRHMVKTYCRGQGCIQIIMETHRVMTYCQGQGCIQFIIMEDTYGQDLLPRPRVYTDHHHHGNTYIEGILPRQRVYADHILETHMVMTYCQVEGYIQIIMETWSRHCQGQVYI